MHVLFNSHILPSLLCSSLPTRRSFAGDWIQGMRYRSRLNFPITDFAVTVSAKNSCLCGQQMRALGIQHEQDSHLIKSLTPISTLSSHLPFPLSSPQDVERRVNAVWSYVPSVHLPLQYARELRAIWGLMGVLVTCLGRESLNYSPGRKCRDSWWVEYSGDGSALSCVSPLILWRALLLSPVRLLLTHP